MGDHYENEDQYHRRPSHHEGGQRYYLYDNELQRPPPQPYLPYYHRPPRRPYHHFPNQRIPRPSYYNPSPSSSSTITYRVNNDRDDWYRHQRQQDDMNNYYNNERNYPESSRYHYQRKKSRSRSRSRSSSEERQSKIKEQEKPEDSPVDETDLTMELYPLTYYVNKKPRMLQEALSVLKGKRLATMIPPILKDMPMKILESSCLAVLEKLDKATVLNILDGKLTSTSKKASSSKFDTVTSVIPPSKLKHKLKRSLNTENSTKKKRRLKKVVKKSSDEDSDDSVAEKEELMNTIKKLKKDKKKQKAKRKLKTANKLNNNSVPSQGQLDQPILTGRTLMELLELEYRAKAIKALLKTQDVDPNEIDDALALDSMPNEKPQLVVPQPAETELKQTSENEEEILPDPRNEEDKPDDEDEEDTPDDEVDTPDDEVEEGQLDDEDVEDKPDDEDEEDTPLTSSAIKALLKTQDVDLNKIDDALSLDSMSNDKPQSVESELELISENEEEISPSPEPTKEEDDEPDDEDEEGQLDDEDVEDKPDDEEDKPDEEDEEDTPLTSSAIKALLKTQDVGPNEIGDALSLDSMSNDKPQSAETELELISENEEDVLPEPKKEEDDKPDNEDEEDTPLTWYHRWYNSKKVQRVVQTNRVFGKLRSKLRKEKMLPDAVKKQDMDLPLKDESDVMSVPIIGSIEEYEKLFGKQVPPPNYNNNNSDNNEESKSISSTENTAAAASQNDADNLKTAEVEEEEDDDDLWGDIMGLGSST